MSEGAWRTRLWSLMVLACAVGASAPNLAAPVPADALSAAVAPQAPEGPPVPGALLVPGPQAQPLSVDEAVAVALRQHPAIREVEAAVAAAEAQVREARAAYFPQLSVSAIIKAGLTGATGALGLPGFPASPAFHEYAYSLNWYQSIFEFGRIRHEVAMRQLLYRSAQFRQSVEEARIVLEARRAYFAVLEAQTLAGASAQLVAERALAAAAVRAGLDAQLRSRLDLDAAEARLADAEAARSRADDAVKTAYAALLAAMGDAGTRTYLLTSPPVAPALPSPLDDLIARALRERPDEQAVEFKIAALEEGLGGVRAKSLPSIRGFAAAGGANFEGTNVPENQQHGVAGAGLLMPLFTGGRLKAERDVAQAQLAGAIAARDQLQQQIRLEVTEAYYQLADRSRQLGALERAQAAADDVLRRAEARRSAQLDSMLTVLGARASVANAAASFTTARLDYARADAQLDFATGRRPRP